jgi:hypothetical protein
MASSSQALTANSKADVDYVIIYKFADICMCKARQKNSQLTTV